MDGSEHCFGGRVAVAMAQIMISETRYWTEQGLYNRNKRNICTVQYCI